VTVLPQMMALRESLALASLLKWPVVSLGFFAHYTELQAVSSRTGFSSRLLAEPFRAMLTQKRAVRPGLAMQALAAAKAGRAGNSSEPRQLLELWEAASQPWPPKDEDDEDTDQDAWHDQQGLRKPVQEAGGLRQDQAGTDIQRETTWQRAATAQLPNAAPTVRDSPSAFHGAAARAFTGSRSGDGPGQRARRVLASDPELLDEHGKPLSPVIPSDLILDR
jgi:hypothetical protein